MIKINKIVDLTSIFLRDSYQNIDIINIDNKKINKKSIYFWMIIILLLALFYISEKIINFLISVGQPIIFLNIYCLVLAILVIFQTILVCTNIFYFSKDLEFVLPLPVKPVELLISKFCTLLCSLYISEIIFGFVPMMIYGMLTHSPIIYYPYILIVFSIFPIFLALIVSIIMMFVMKISKFIRNKEAFQVIMTLILMTFIFAVEYKLMGSIILSGEYAKSIEQEQIVEQLSDFNNRIESSNKYFLVINPCVKILTKPSYTSIIEIAKIMFINLIAFFIFFSIGKVTYLKDILKNAEYINNKKNKKIILKSRCRLKNKSISYIKKEFKMLFKSSMFFMQCVYPVLILLLTLTIISVIVIPKINLALQNEQFIKNIGNNSFDINAVYIMLGIIQLLFMMSPASLTAISREGKSAIFMKYIPISFYKQFIYKGIPQIFINTISLIVVIGIIHYAIPSIGMIYIGMIFILAMLLNIVNSYTMLIVDAFRPKLEWDTEYAVLKQNNNKIFQYVFAILIILLLIYLSKIFKDICLNIALIITGAVFFIILILMNIFIIKIQNKLFKKII